VLTNRSLEEMMSEEEIQRTQLELISPFFENMDHFSERFIRIHGIMSNLKEYFTDCYFAKIPLIQEINKLRITENEEINIHEESVNFEELPISLYAQRTRRTMAIIDGKFLVGRFNIVEASSTLPEVGYTIEQIVETPTIKKLKEEIEAKQISISEKAIEKILEEGPNEQSTMEVKNIQISPDFIAKLLESREEIEFVIHEYLLEYYNLRERIKINKYNTIGEEVNKYHVKRKFKRSIPLSQFLIENINPKIQLEIIDEKFTFKKPDGSKYQEKGCVADYVAEAFDNKNNKRIGIIFYTQITNPFAHIENDISGWLFDPSTAADNIQKKLKRLNSIQEMKPAKQAYIWQVKIDQEYLNKLKL